MISHPLLRSDNGLTLLSAQSVVPEVPPRSQEPQDAADTECQNPREGDAGVFFILNPRGVLIFLAYVAFFSNGGYKKLGLLTYYFTELGLWLYWLGTAALTARNRMSMVYSDRHPVSRYVLL